MEQVLAGPGTVLAGRYTIERELGRGGMATVYLAHDIKHHRPVAVKILRPEVAVTLGSERFLREIEIAARLTHPHILPLHDSGEAGELLYYVMPFIGGESLRDRIRREGRLPVEAAVRITREVADALSYAHGQGVVHRDIKPGNILLEAGHAVVSDFGIARAVTAAAGDEITTSGLAIGTPMYMSPEQVAGSRVDGRSDVYSLGCVLFEMLAGEPPFAGPNAQAVGAKHIKEAPPTLSQIRPDVPVGVTGAIETALAKRPEDRFPDAAEFAHALELPSLTRPLGRRFAGRRRAWVLATAGILALLAISFVIGPRLTGGALITNRQPAWILVADFEGPTQDPSLADAVRELVTAELDQSRYVATMPRQQLTAVMRDAGLPDTLHLTASLARELAFRSSVRAILTGSVRPIGTGQYSMVVRVVDAQNERTVFTGSEAATDRDLVVKAQQLGRQIRRGLGERRADVESNVPLTQAATPSFEAYRKFVDATNLAIKGDVDGSNGLLRDALALDSGFAAAWASMSVNYAIARDEDSSRLALLEALKRPDRLNTAQRYRLEGEAAYRLHYDLPAAVRWYQLYLEHAPQSMGGHNNLGVYLASSGRYEEALDEFQVAARLDPFGPANSQIQLSNAAAMLLALGRIGEAARVAQQLSGPFADEAAMLQATAAGKWSVAESLAEVSASDAGTPDWLKPSAITMWAGSLAARGAVTTADRLLRNASAATLGPTSRWYRQAALLLEVASGRPVAPLTAGFTTDTSPGGLVLRALVAGARGDTVRARDYVGKLDQLPRVEQLRLGDGPAVAQAWIAARGAKWDEVLDMIGERAYRGEHDGSSRDQVASISTRWLVADAYERVGRLDSAAAFFELAIAPTRVPFSHLALRGLAYPFAQRRLALLYERLHQQRLSDERWDAFNRTFVTPDPELKPLLTARKR